MLGEMSNGVKDSRGCACFRHTVLSVQLEELQHCMAHADMPFGPNAGRAVLCMQPGWRHSYSMASGPRHGQRTWTATLKE